MNNIINKIFNNIEYWQDKKLLLRAINPEYYSNKKVIIQLLGITSGMVSYENDAKKDMWNHQINQHNMGDDILKNVHPDILNDFEFAKTAIGKYNRTYKYINKSLQASHELAMAAALKEIQSTKEKYSPPILQYMPEIFKIDSEIALVATTRNIENLEYAHKLKQNKYFIIDVMNLVDDNKIKQKVLKLIDQDLLNDKNFVAKLGCFDNLCEKFHGDIEYIANAVKHDLNILKKTKLFDEKIIKAVLQSDYYKNDKNYTLAILFRYIEKFNENFEELNQKIKNKKILNELFWMFGETISDEFI